MNKKFLFCILFSFNCVLFSSCHIEQQHLESGTPSFSSEYEQKTTSHVSGYEGVVSQNQYYKIYQVNEDYFYCLFDKEGTIICEENTGIKPAEISMLTDSIIKISLQAGTGRGSRWTYYYDIIKDCPSRVFINVLTEEENLVAYTDGNLFVVRDIFNKQNLYKKIDNLSLAEVEDPWVQADFMNNFREIAVTYLSGDNLEEKVEVISLC